MSYSDQNLFGSTIRIEHFKRMVAEVIKEELNNILNIQKETIREGLKREAEKPMSITDISRHFGVTKVTIHNWRKRGLIEGVKVGRNRYFQRSEVQEALSKYGHREDLRDSLNLES